MKNEDFLHGENTAVYKAELDEIYPLIKEVISGGGKFTFKPSGSSMKPFIRPGRDAVNLTWADNPGKYDIVLYRRKNGQFVLHRIVAEDEKGFVMCGDNQWTKEYNITRDMIIAKVSGVIRNGHTVECSSKRSMIFAHLWCDAFGFRKAYLKFRSIIKRLLKK